MSAFLILPFPSHLSPLISISPHLVAPILSLLLFNRFSLPTISVPWITWQLSSLCLLALMCPWLWHYIDFAFIFLFSISIKCRYRRKKENVRFKHTDRSILWAVCRVPVPWCCGSKWKRASRGEERMFFALITIGTLHWKLLHFCTTLLDFCRWNIPFCITINLVHIW